MTSKLQPKFACTALACITLATGISLGLPSAANATAEAHLIAKEYTPARRLAIACRRYAAQEARHFLTATHPVYERIFHLASALTQHGSGEVRSAIGNILTARQNQRNQASTVDVLSAAAETHLARHETFKPSACALRKTRYILNQVDRDTCRWQKRPIPQAIVVEQILEAAYDAAAIVGNNLEPINRLRFGLQQMLAGAPNHSDAFVFMDSHLKRANATDAQQLLRHARADLAELSGSSHIGRRKSPGRESSRKLARILHYTLRDHKDNWQEDQVRDTSESFSICVSRPRDEMQPEVRGLAGQQLSALQLELWRHPEHHRYSESEIDPLLPELYDRQSVVGLMRRAVARTVADLGFGLH